MKGRVFVGGFHHESATFNPIITSREEIRVRRGAELLVREESSLSGGINTLIAAGYEVVPSLIARAVPNGVWSRAYYEELKAEFLEALRSAGKLDAILLSLHGSMRVEGIGEAEQDLLKAVRLIYPDLLIVSSLDMHATFTRNLKASLDAVVGYKCAPHTDTYETGISAALIVIRSLESGRKPAMAAVRIPMLVAGEQSETSVEPMLSLIEDLHRVERSDGVFACSYLLGFPWADGSESSVHAVVVTNGDQAQAESLANSLASRLWERRTEFSFYTDTRMPEDALRYARQSIAEGIYPVVISDSGDNPTAGGSGDVMQFLSLILADSMLRTLDPPLVYQGIYDPAVVREAFQAGVGARFTSSLGAKYYPAASHPLEGTFTVRSLVSGWEKAGGVDLALLDVGGVDVVVMSRHEGCYDPEMMRALGVAVEDRKVIVVKLGYLEPDIRALAARSVMALTEGGTDELFTRLPYRNLPRPIYPLDGDFEADLELL